MFYLTTHSTNFIYGYMASDNSDSERGNSLPPHGLLFPIRSKESFICTIPHMIAHTTAFVTPVVGHWLEREIAQWVHHEGSSRRPIALLANALTRLFSVTQRLSHRTYGWTLFDSPPCVGSSRRAPRRIYQKP